MVGGRNIPGINFSCVQKTITPELVSKVFFPFLQALGHLGINNKFVIEALWQVVSSGAVWSSGVCRGWEHGHIRLSRVPGKVRVTVV